MKNSSCCESYLYVVKCNLEWVFFFVLEAVVYDQLTLYFFKHRSRLSTVLDCVIVANMLEV